MEGFLVDVMGQRLKIHVVWRAVLIVQPAVRKITRGSLVGSWLCLLQFIKKCHGNDYFVVKMFSRPHIYLFFLKRIVEDELTI